MTLIPLVGGPYNGKFTDVIKRHLTILNDSKSPEIYYLKMKGDKVKYKHIKVEALVHESHLK